MKYFDRKTIDLIRKGYFSAVYFNRTKEILERENNYKKVTMQIFQRNDESRLCGVEEVVELFKQCTGLFLKDKWVSKVREIEIRSLKDGSQISQNEPAMHIIGPYIYFAHLESVYLGILARRTMVATNVKKAVNAANGKPVIFFADRFDYFLNQEGDGFAAHIAGASGVCTKAHASWWQGQASGTIPHALIAVNEANTVTATKLFAKYFGKKAKVIALVDFHNDCVRDALETARVLGSALWGVRFDTAHDLVDKSLQKTNNNKNMHGVNVRLVRNVRQALDKEGFNRIKIVVSGGFDEKKIKHFEEAKAPVDIYGVGSSLVHGVNDFTADIVRVEGEEVAKVGRNYKENTRFKKLL